MLANGDITRGASTAAPSASPLGLQPGTLYSAQRHPNFFGWATDAADPARSARARSRRAGCRCARRSTRACSTPRAPRSRASCARSTDPAAALVAIDPRTGAVKAMVSYLPDGRQMKFNLATQAARQAGSSFKPFTLAAGDRPGDLASTPASRARPS